MLRLFEPSVRVLLVDPYRQSIEELTVNNDADVFRKLVDFDCRNLLKMPLLSEDVLLLNATPIHTNMIEKVTHQYFTFSGGSKYYGRGVICGWDDVFDVAKSTSIKLQRAKNTIEFFQSPLVGNA